MLKPHTTKISQGPEMALPSISPISILNQNLCVQKTISKSPLYQQP